MKKSGSGTETVRTGVRGLLLHRAIAQRVRDRQNLTTSATGNPEVRLIGLDPVRVLVIGSGLAVGYGVHSHADALTGALAEAIQAGGSRGVIVQNRSSGGTRIEDTVAELGAAAATTFHTVVWCPSPLDILRRPDRGSYNRAMMDGLRLLRETARPNAEIIMCTLPSPTKRGPIEEVVRTVLPRFNRALARAVAPLPNVRVAETPRFSSLMDPDALSPDYYRQVAAMIVDPAAAVSSARSA